MNWPLGASVRRALLQESAPIGQMLDHFESHNEIEAAIGEGQIAARGLLEGEIGRLIMRAREFDGVRGGIDSHHALRGAREFGRAVTRAASCVERALAARQARGEGVARHVLVEQVDIDLAGNDPLARELSQRASPKLARSLRCGKADGCSRRFRPPSGSSVA